MVAQKTKKKKENQNELENALADQDRFEKYLHALGDDYEFDGLGENGVLSDYLRFDACYSEITIVGRLVEGMEHEESKNWHTAALPEWVSELQYELCERSNSFYAAGDVLDILNAMN